MTIKYIKLAIVFQLFFWLLVGSVLLSGCAGRIIDAEYAGKYEGSSGNFTYTEKYVIKTATKVKYYIDIKPGVKMWIEKRDTGVAVYHTLQPGNYFILEVRKR
jgi:hypothetical protein